MYEMVLQNNFPEQHVPKPGYYYGYQKLANFRKKLRNTPNKKL